MGKGKFLHMGVLSVAVVAVAGCDDRAGMNRGKRADGPATAALDWPATARLVERDVEAPEVLSKNEPGLWDGRPSLGGVWVAYPGVKGSRRVIIRNEANGTFVIGSLFKRRGEVMGPRIQISADAANALKILPGTPTKLNVVALVREEVLEATTTAATESLEHKPLDAPLVVAGAVMPLNGTPSAEKITEPVRAKRGFWNRMKNRNAQRQAAPAYGPATQQIAPTPTPRATTPEVGGKNFIQIGIFSEQANANRTADNMRKAGIVPTVDEQQSAGKRFWRVVLGPAHAPADRQELLKKVNALGFQDAYFVEK